MSNIIPFNETAFQLPAHLMSASAGLSLNDAAEEFSAVKYPVISIKNGRFWLKRDDDKNMILRPKANATDPDEPATYIDLVVLNLQKSKTFYAEGYTDGSEAKPDCSSNDGVKPDSGAENKQCDTCALCPHNAWGSGTNDKGEATKGKACSDVLRLAVAAATNIDDPMLLRVPPASLKNLSEMSRLLSKKNIPLNAVLVRTSFDSAATGVVLTFKPVGFLDAAGFAQSQSKMTDDLVLAIVGKSTRGVLDNVPAHVAAISVGKPAEPPKVEAPKVDAEAEAAAKAAKAKAEAKAKKVAAARAAAEAAAKAAAEAEADDDAEEAVAAAPAVTAKSETKVATSDSFDDELAALIG